MTLSKTYHILLRKHFLLVQCIQTSLLMASSDVISQELIEKRGWRNFDACRTLQFGFLGGCLVGPAVTAWYKILARQFGHKKNLATTLKKVTADQLIFAPGFYPIFIGCVGLLRGNNFQQIEDKLKNEYCDVLMRNWQVWPLVQAANFYFIPFKFQVLFVQSVAIVWNTYLSWETHRDN